MLLAIAFGCAPNISNTSSGKDEAFSYPDLSKKIYCRGKGYVVSRGNINGRLHLPYTTEQQRHDQISDWALSIIDTAIGNIFIEGYSFGSKGLVFNLAENMGTLKHKLYKLNKRFQSIVPGQIKKNATGKGNADKLKMYEQFTKDTGVDLVKEFEQTKLNNPVTDIVDSYYIAKYGYES